LLSGVGEASDVGARLGENKRTPPARLQSILLVPEVEQHLKIGLAALCELVGRGDCRGDDLAVSEWLNDLDVLLRITGAAASTTI
jgi:hypothetical protein